MRLAPLLLLLASSLHAFSFEFPPSVEKARTEIWKRFIDKHGVFIDFTDLNGSVTLPTPEECKAGMPNALGWYQPIENGAMFNGLYMDAAVSRWERTKSQEDAAAARRLMEGLLFLNSVSEVKGFVARGVSTDGKSHYPMGSNDQTGPWYFGLWRYYFSGIASEAEKARITKHLGDTTEAILALNWKMPAEMPFKTRGSFAGFHFEEVARQLFVLKLMHAVTGAPKWDALYQAALNESGGPENLSKKTVCENGMKFFYAKTHNWTSCCAVAALRGLWEMEPDLALKASYARGLHASALLASESLPLASQYKREDKRPFDIDWRKAMMPLWEAQTTEQQAVDLAGRQLKEFFKISPGRQPETAFIREPLAAAWIVTLDPDPAFVSQHKKTVEEMVERLDYGALYYCTFFWAESAWLRLPH